MTWMFRKESVVKLTKKNEAMSSNVQRERPSVVKI